MKLRITIENVSYEVDVEVLEGGEAAAPAYRPAPAPARPAAAPVAPPPMPAPAPAAAGGSGEKVCKSPIAGTVMQIKVKPGDTVAVNQVILIMEAMKMETNIASPVAGKVKSIKVNAGEAVKQGQLLVDFE